MRLLALLTYVLLLSTAAFSQSDVAALMTQGRASYATACVDNEGTTFDKRRCLQTREVLRQAVMRAPENAEANYLYGKTSLAIDHAADLEPKTPKAGDGIAYLRKAIQLNPQYIDGYYALANAESPSASIEIMKTILKIDPHQELAYKVLVGSYLSGSVEEALAWYRKYRTEFLLHNWADIDPDLDGNMAIALAAVGRFADSAEVYQSMIRIALASGTRERACAVLPLARGPSGAVELAKYSAVPDFQKLIQSLRPYCNQTEHWQAGGNLEIKADYEGALREYQAQLVENPLYAQTYPSLAKLQLRLGRSTEATGVLEHYWSIEDDVSQRCRMLPEFGNLNSYEKEAPAAVRRFRSECEGSNR